MRINPAPEDYERAQQLQNMHLLDADGMRRAYTELAAYCYALERKLQQIEPGEVKQ